MHDNGEYVDSFEYHPVIKHGKLGNLQTKGRFIAGRIIELYKRWIFQQAMFDYQRVNGLAFPLLMVKSHEFPLKSY
jgi:hypothetical protein